MSRGRLVLAALLGLWIASLSGCSWFPRAGADTQTGPVWVRLELDKQVYRPGEMVVATVEISNTTEGPVVIQQPVCSRFPSHANLTFRFYNTETHELLRRAPVIVREPQGGGAGDYAPPLTLEQQWDKAKPKLAFVNLTGGTGQFQIRAEYKVMPVVQTMAGARNLKKTTVRSAPVTFQVEGEPLFTREPNGLISKRDAQRVALLHYDPDHTRRFTSMRAALVGTESDLLDWWVAFDRAPADVREGEDATIAFFVSPYGGFVRKQAPPFTRDPVAFLEAQSLDPNPQRPTFEEPLHALGRSKAPTSAPAEPVPARPAPPAGGAGGGGRR